MSIANSLLYAWRLLRYGDSDTQDYKIHPERAVQNGGIVSTIETNYRGIPRMVTYPYGGGERTENIGDLLRRTDTKAFVVIKNEQVIYEAYLNSNRDSLNTSFSAAKSFNSAMRCSHRGRFDRFGGRPGDQICARDCRAWAGRADHSGPVADELDMLAGMEPL